MNRSLLEKVRCLLSTAGLDKSFWAEELTCGSHLLNRLPLTAIGCMTPMKICSGGVARDHGLLWVFGCPAYICAKRDNGS